MTKECKEPCYQQWVDMFNKKDKECFNLNLKLSKIENYCRQNRQCGWVDIEGIIDIIRGEDK